MRPALLRASLSLAALAAASIVTSCASPTAQVEAEARAEAERIAAEVALQGPPVALNQSVAESAAVYIAFARDMATIEGGFESPEAIQAALARASSYDPEKLSRGLIAYASILALQSPEFVQGVRGFNTPEATRRRIVDEIVADPKRASRLPGADAAAGLIIASLQTDVEALSRAANSIENDAYNIQNPWDPRRGWAVTQIADRPGRLAAAHGAGEGMLPPATLTARLFAAAHDGTGLTTREGRRTPPYPPAVENALALAALAALGAAGENARPNTDALQFDWTSRTCMQMAKLNLLQCLAASRPNYEDIFCLGRHVVRDLSTCTRGAALPAAIVTVSGLTTTEVVEEPPAPRIVIAPDPEFAPPAPRITPAPAIAPGAAASPARTPVPPPTGAPARSLTERLNTGAD